MSLILNYTVTSSNLPAFLQGWEDSFEYRGAGSFNQIRNTTDQWFAGNRVVGGVPNDKSSVIVNGDNFNPASGVVGGDVQTLELGSNLTYSATGDVWTQDEGLLVNLNSSPLTAAWDNAIADLSQNGSLEGLYAYFAEQGTIQNGTAGDDTLLSFGGDDVFTGGAGNDTFVFADDWANDSVADFGSESGNDDILDLSAISEISGYVDLVLHHSNFWDWTNTLTISVGSNTIALDGYVGTDIFELILDGNILV